MIQVALPTHLRTLANVSRVVEVQVEAPATLEQVLDALEANYPTLRGTIRDHVTHERRPFIRFFVCGEDWSHQPTDAPLPAAILAGEELLRVLGAMAGG